MRTRKPSSLLIFMTLVVLCCQAVAAPFLTCSDSLQPAGETAEEHCARMMAQIATGQHLTAMGDMDMTSSTADSSGQASHQMTDYCKFTCQYCRGVSTFSVIAPAAPSSPLILTWSRLNPALSPAVQPPSDHFRPPTIA